MASGSLKQYKSIKKLTVPTISGFTMGHIQLATRLKYSTTDKEKCREYNIPRCVAFVDYEKAFDTVQTQAILTSLQEQGIEDVYIEILKYIYTDS